MNLHDAIFKLNPGVVTIRDDVAFDKEEKVVSYNLKQAKALVEANKYKELRAAEYPDIKEYLDGIVKGDEAQVQEYIDACLAVKAKYPKPEGV